MNKDTLWKSVVHILLTLIACIMVLPLLWIVLTAFKERNEVFSLAPQWLPQKPTLKNFFEVLDAMPFWAYYWNTLVVAFGTLAIQFMTITPAAYAFGRLQFRGRDVLFMLFLVQLMIAPQSTIVQNYFTINKLGLLDTRLGIMAPYLASAYGTFLLRQTFKSIPQELEDSAKIDGCGGLRFLWHVAIPLSKPGYLAFSLVSLTYHWNEFFWPLVITETNRARTLTLGLGIFAQTSEGSADWTVLMAATLMVIAGPLALFLLFQKHFIGSFMQSGIRG
ncbi:ABC transporter permease protein [Candidatus Vecturithrix granuli]|uniref:ABC transporter permease protein n=1 Tax=Vecturithrix granuli TaxID=1499967 RepID=A0A0S6W8S6_VECG1|nr:ABC transporter permease protein [Candidatus Vecturithrix granuli]